MTRLYCRLFGHIWRRLGADDLRAATCLVCTRCHENGWEL